MQCDAENLIWIDLEMTGLDTQADAIIEIATVVTDKHLNERVDGPVIAVHQDESVLAKMDDWNQQHHGSSGLLERVRCSVYSEAQAQQETLDFLKAYVPEGVSPMCGNSICQDRRFLHRCMPELEHFFHYRNMDVSTLKELMKRWRPELGKQFEKKGAHLALDDVYDSIDELIFYRAHFLQV